ncbi:hypothetical protein C8F04DRAFT_230068 [Mycena alexandri]|uniref:Uncharacterized protein n=1 Tax=Mycena alexandri TaxID=1745969 RepID=A0AAD6WRT1_9AGAR|nr:hypothetical protein C8F04DRAFT_230068 [Mycena alexandri]
MALVIRSSQPCPRRPLVNRANNTNDLAFIRSKEEEELGQAVSYIQHSIYGIAAHAGRFGNPTMKGIHLNIHGSKTKDMSLKHRRVSFSFTFSAYDAESTTWRRTRVRARQLLRWSRRDRKGDISISHPYHTHFLRLVVPLHAKSRPDRAGRPPRVCQYQLPESLGRILGSPHARRNVARSLLGQRRLTPWMLVSLTHSLHKRAQAGCGAEFRGWWRI